MGFTSWCRDSFERRQKTAGAARLAVVPRATTAELTSFVQDVIRPHETTVFTDAWGAYAALGRLWIDHRPRKGPFKAALS